MTIKNERDTQKRIIFKKLFLILLFFSEHFSFQKLLSEVFFF